MKIKSQDFPFLFVSLLFGVIFAFDQFSRFGWQAVDLPPVKFFFFSLGVSLRNVFCYTLLISSSVFVLGCWARWFLVPLLWYMVLIEGATIYTSKIFHASLGEIWMPLLENTSWGELSRFIGMTVGIVPVVFLVVVFTVLVLLSRLLWRLHYPRRSCRSLIIGGCCILPFVVIHLVIMNWHWGIAQTHASNFPIISYLSYLRQTGVNAACKNINLPQTIGTEVEFSQLPNAVIVLGESATRNNWHLYGYPRSTTPSMDALCASGEAVCVKNVISAQPDTVSSLSVLLTDVSEVDRMHGNWTLAEVYRRAGYRCVLISNQYSWGDSSSTLYRLFNGCEKRYSLSREFGDGVFDEKVVTLLQRELEVKDERPVAMFIHLGGMHYPVQHVIPDSEAFFTDAIEAQHMMEMSVEQRDRFNRYDDAIRYEDKVLGMIVEELSRTRRASFMFFISDHGESPRSKNWRNFEDVDVYEVPCIVWFSNEYRLCHAPLYDAVQQASCKPFTNDELTYGIVALGRIVCPDGKESSFSPRFQPRTPRYINKGRILYNER